MFDQVKNRDRFSRAGECQAVVCVSAAQSRNLWLGKRWRQGNWLMLTLWLVSCLVGCGGDGSAVVIQGTLSATESGSIDSDQTPQQGSETVSDAQMSGLMPGGSVEGDTSAAIIYVHVCGQVVTPGVYALPEGSRVWDAVKEAGGLTEEAQPDAVNLAWVVADGSKVTIPSQAQAQSADFRWYETGTGDRSPTEEGTGDSTASGQTGESREDGRVDLNRADVAALMVIPGIGEARAQAIVAYREARGPFGSIEEIMQVAGIKEGLFAKIRDYITVGG